MGLRSARIGHTGADAADSKFPPIRALLNENFSKVKCNTVSRIYDACRLAGPLEPRPFAHSYNKRKTEPMRSFRLSALGRTVTLLGGELACNTIIWAISGFLFRKPESRGVLSLCLLAWVRPY